MSRRIDICPTCKGKGEIIVDNWLTEGMTEEEIAKEKEKALADIVEVVRCKECKHYSLAMLKCCFPLDDKHTFDEYVPPIWQPNDYCSYGERREE